MPKPLGGSPETDGRVPQREAADLITLPQAAKRLGLHRDTLYRLARSGQFPPAIQIGSTWRVSIPRLERYLHGEPSS